MPQTTTPGPLADPRAGPIETVPGTLADQLTGTSQVVQSDRIELVEERVTVSKREVESGHAKVRISVSEHDETVEALLMRQDLEIVRVPVGTIVPGVPPVRTEGDTVIVPVLEEVLVTETRLMLKEELRISIRRTRHTETQTVRLRREHAEIEQDGISVDPNASRSPS